MAPTIRYLWASVRMLLVFTFILGIGYPLVVFGIGQVGFHNAANGSIVSLGGKVVGSRLIGQEFTGAQWFHPRPSAAGSGYDAMASGASNLSPSSATLLAQVEQRRAQIARADHVAPGAVPADALTASGSGLDPDISPQYATEQIARVADARHLPRPVVAGLVKKFTVGRPLGFLGEPSVNVLSLNLALASTRP